MRIVLQHKDTGLYFVDLDRWTHKSVEAMDFVSSASAIEFCETNDIGYLQIVLKFEREKYDIVMQADTNLTSGHTIRVHA